VEAITLYVLVRYDHRFISRSDFALLLRAISSAALRHCLASYDEFPAGISANNRRSFNCVSLRGAAKGEPTNADDSRH
jgi:hypothetical protein